MTTQIFFDIDGCLITPRYEYNMNIELFKNAIDNIKSKNFVLNLNSNRSLETIMKIRKDLDFNGVVIYENGIGIYNPKTEEKKSYGFTQINKDKIQKIINLNNYNCNFISTDKIIKYPESFAKQLSKETIFCEQSREYTMTLYPRKLEEGVVIAGDLINIKNIMQENFPQYECSINYKYNNVLIIPLGAKKGSNLANLILNNNSASFGDEIADISMFEITQYCGCPLNAYEDVKKDVIKRNGMITNQKYTAGAFEFIKRIGELI